MQRAASVPPTPSSPSAVSSRSPSRRSRDRAGLTLAELTAAYPTKRELVVAVLQRWHGAWRRALDRIASAESDPRDEVLAIFRVPRGVPSRTRVAWLRLHQRPRGARSAGPGRSPSSRVSTSSTSSGTSRSVCERGAMPAHIAQGLSLLIEGARVESAVQRSRAAGALRSAGRRRAHVGLRVAPDLLRPRARGRWLVRGVLSRTTEGPSRRVISCATALLVVHSAAAGCAGCGLRAVGLGRRLGARPPRRRAVTPWCGALSAPLQAHRAA